MKPESIIVGNTYEVQAGRNKTKVKVVSFDPKKSSWQCETPKGKRISIKDPERFLNEFGQRSDVGPRLASPSKSPLHVASLADTSVQRKRVTSTERKLQPPTPARGPKPLGEMSILSAAHRVLLEAGHPMKVQEIMETALAKGYCKVGGKTPFNTFNGGIRSDITKKGNESRFKRVDKGLFAAR